MPENALMMPNVVPNRPTKGAVAPIVARPLLESRLQHLGQMRQLVLLAVGDVDRVLDLALLQVAGHLGGVLAGLLGRLAERPVPLDHDRDRVHGHEEEYGHDAPRDPAHVLGHVH
jgi:hypothetical protein